MGECIKLSIVLKLHSIFILISKYILYLWVFHVFEMQKNVEIFSENMIWIIAIKWFWKETCYWAAIHENNFQTSEEDIASVSVNANSNMENIYFVIFNSLYPHTII
jgi:hypothetical protein